MATIGKPELLAAVSKILDGAKVVADYAASLTDPQPVPEPLPEPEPVPTPPPPARLQVKPPLPPVVNLPASPAKYGNTAVNGAGKAFTGFTSNASTVFPVTGPADKLRLANFRTDGAALLLKNTGGFPMRDAVIEDGIMENSRYSSYIGFIRASNSDFSRLRISRFFYRLVTTVDGNVQAVICIYGKEANDVADGFLFEDGTIILEKGVSYTGYPNLDPIAVEAGYKNGLIRRMDVKGPGNNTTDGGIDLKSPGTRVEDYKADGFGKSFRVWVPGKHGVLHSANPAVDHNMRMGSGTVELDGQIIEGGTDKPIVAFNDGGTWRAGEKSVWVFHSIETFGRDWRDPKNYFVPPAKRGLCEVWVDGESVPLP